MEIPGEFYFCPERRMWRNASTAGVADVLTDPELLVNEPSTIYEAMAHLPGREFPNVRFALRYILALQNGERHAFLRELATEHIRRTSRQVRVAREAAIQDMQKRFSAGGHIELMSEVVAPLVRKIMLALTGNESSENTSDIFYPTHSLRMVRQLEEKVARAQANIDQRFPDETEDQKGVRLALSLLGSDPLTAGIGANMAAILAPADNSRICELGWTRDLSQVAVIFLTRLPKPGSTIPLSGATEPVNLVSVDLNSFLTDPTQSNPGAIFGMGVHACLGRGLATAIWREIAACMQEFTARVSHIETQAADHWLFNIPRAIHIKVSNDT